MSSGSLVRSSPSVREPHATTARTTPARRRILVAAIAKGSFCDPIHDEPDLLPAQRRCVPRHAGARGGRPTDLLDVDRAARLTGDQDVRPAVAAALPECTEGPLIEARLAVAFFRSNAVVVAARAARLDDRADLGLEIDGRRRVVVGVDARLEA